MLKKLNNKVKVLILSVLLLIISISIIIINGKTYIVEFNNLNSSYNLDNLTIEISEDEGIIKCTDKKRRWNS